MSPPLLDPQLSSYPCPLRLPIKMVTEERQSLFFDGTNSHSHYVMYLSEWHTLNNFLVAELPSLVNFVVNLCYQLPNFDNQNRLI